MADEIKGLKEHIEWQTKAIKAIAEALKLKGFDVKISEPPEPPPPPN